MLEFKDKLKQYRIDNNLTQDQLADILHVSRGAISKYETGRSYPSIEILQEIAALLGVTVDEMLSKTELAKETIDTSNKIKITRYISFILAFLILIVFGISIIAMVQTSKNKLNSSLENDSIFEKYAFCGLIGVTTDDIMTHVTFSKDDLMNDKYFGCLEIYENDFSYNKIFNCIGAHLNYKTDGYSFNTNIYLNKKVRGIKYFYVYYNEDNNEYLVESDDILHLAYDGLTQTIFEKEHQGNKYYFEINYVWFDSMIEMKIIEFDIKGNILKETKYTDIEEYIVDDEMLYLVIEEKLIDKNNNVYYNREIIFNEEINNTYYHVLKIPNENLIATQSLLIKKK